LKEAGSITIRGYIKVSDFDKISFLDVRNIKYSQSSTVVCFIGQVTPINVKIATY
jgi:hypothetical protein